jgi:hypothetical protein
MAPSTGLECPHPGQQYRLVRQPVRHGTYSARFQEGPGDNWTNGSIRCLLASYGSGEKEGDDYYYALSMYFPSMPSDNLVWELHQQADIYEVDHNTSVTPHAITVVKGRLAYRLLTGPAYWDGTSWVGWSHYEPDIDLLGPLPLKQWIDVVVHIKFTHSDQGLLEVWAHVGDAPWTDRPQISRNSVPTLQWIPGFRHEIWGHPNDPRVPDDIMTSTLYLEMGLYRGVDWTATTDVVYLADYRRGTSLAAVQPALAGSPPRS